MAQIYIYSLDDFFSKWDLLMDDVKKRRIARGQDFYEDYYNQHRVVALLLFYGLSPEQVASLKLSDITDEGIEGYDIEFNEKVLELMKEYRQQTGFRKVNNGYGSTAYMYYKQNTVVRTTVEDSQIDATTISELLSAREFCKSEYQELFKPTNLIGASKYNALYKYCQETGLDLTRTGKSSSAHVKPHLKKVTDILGIKHDEQDTSRERRMIKMYYVEKYLIPRKEWEQEQGNNIQEQTPTLTYEEKIDRSFEQLDTTNREILKRKLLDRISYVEMELAELRKLVDTIC